MKISVLTSFVMLSTLAFAQNSCMDALEISAGMHTVDVVDGELPPAHCWPGSDFASAGKWYVYTATANYNVTVSSSFEENAGTFGIDTRLQILSGTCDDLSCLDADDDSGMESTSIVTVQVLIGETIYIAWDDALSEEGFIFELVEAEYVAPPISFTPIEMEEPGDYMGMVDMNGDFLDDLVKVSGIDGISIAYQVPDGSLNLVAIGNEPAVNFPYWSLTAGDIDGNGFNDLVYGGGNGVTFMYANDDGTDYSEVSGTESVFSKRGNCIDIDNDGNLDVFMCHDLEPNVYYTNNGDGNLSFAQGGLGDVPNGGNYGSIWVDYDSDGDTDMFIAKWRGGNSPARLNEMHRNNGDGSYTEVAIDLALDDSVQTWSSAWGDFDNDGDLDMFIGASSFINGGHKLLRNDGDGVFTDVTEGSGITEDLGHGMENVTHDFDNDGHLDILGIGGNFLFNNGDMTFEFFDSPVTNGGVGDMNNDGSLDIMNDQLQVNDGNDNNWLKLNVVGTVSNLNGIGAMIHLYSQDFGVQTRQVRSGDGFRYMSSLNVHFGLGQTTELDSLVVDWPSGMQSVIEDLELNTTLLIVEENEDNPDGLAELYAASLDVYPNPVSEVLNIEMPIGFKSMSYAIYDVNGRKLAAGMVANKQIRLPNLSTGAYVLSLDIDGNKVERTLIKE